jgi:hypothetical protein
MEQELEELLSSQEEDCITLSAGTPYQKAKSAGKAEIIQKIRKIIKAYQDDYRG